jgi:hypothetical protein
MSLHIVYSIWTCHPSLRVWSLAWWSFRSLEWIGNNIPPIRVSYGFALLSYPVFMPKPSTHRMHDPGSNVLHVWPKVFTHNQMPRMKYNYYISNISKDWWLSMKRNSGILHNPTGTATGATCSLELFVKEFKSIFSFWAAGLSSRGK